MQLNYRNSLLSKFDSKLSSDILRMYLKRTILHVYIFLRIWRILVDFAKLNTRNFLLNGICENKYTLNMHKIHIRENNIYTKKNMHKKVWLIQLFLESITAVFPSRPACLSVELILTETLAKCPLIQMSYFFSLGLKFINSKF